MNYRTTNELCIYPGEIFNDIRENNNRIWLLKQLLLSMVTVAMVQPYQEQANTIGYAH